MIAAAGISKKYKKQILNSVNFTCNEGEIVGLVGKNGSGKSTFLSILAGLIKPDAGSYSIFGGDALNDKNRILSNIGFVPQANSLFENMTVKDNLSFWYAAAGKKFTKDTELLFHFDKASLKKKVNQLSGGTQKKLSINLAFINSPQFLIMDEPTSALDMVSKSQVTESMKQLRADGKAVVFTTHGIDEIALCDTVYAIENGVFLKMSRAEYDLDSTIYHINKIINQEDVYV